MKKINIFDANNLLRRGYHAIHDRVGLKTSGGVLVGAVYGFFRMAVRLIREYKPDYAIFVFDGGNERRQKLFSDYKRKENPDPTLESFYSQIDIAIELIESLGLEPIKRDTVEADDVIAGLTLFFEEKKDYQIEIISADHDFWQLISKNTKVISPNLIAGVIDKIHDLSYVKERFGVEPKTLPHIWALTGDKADNISGIPGVGEKTAINLIKKSKICFNVPIDFEKYARYQDLISLNYILINLRDKDRKQIGEDLSERVLKSCLINHLVEGEIPKRFINFLEKYEFNSVLKQIKIGKGIW